jgi:hypothetical protein
MTGHRIQTFIQIQKTVLICFRGRGTLWSKLGPTHDVCTIRCFNGFIPEFPINTFVLCFIESVSEGPAGVVGVGGHARQMDGQG